MCERWRPDCCLRLPGRRRGPHRGREKHRPGDARTCGLLFNVPLSARSSGSRSRSAPPRTPRRRRGSARPRRSLLIPQMSCIRGARDPDDASFARQREVVAAFLAASRTGDFAALLEVLDPDVVFRAEAGLAGPAVPALVRGARAVAAVVMERGAPFAHLGRRSSTEGRARSWLSRNAWCRWSLSRSSATASPRWTCSSIRRSSVAFDWWTLEGVAPAHGRYR